MHLHDRVLGLVDRRFENALVELYLPGRRVGTRCAVVVDVAVERPELIGEAAERRRERVVGGDRIGPYGVAAHRGNDHAAQDGELRECRNEGDVRMPPTCSTILAVKIEHRLGAGERRYYRVRNEWSQQPCEGLMPGFVEMALAAEKDDPMAQQGIANCGHRLGLQIAGQPYTMDFCTDR